MNKFRRRLLVRLQEMGIEPADLFVILDRHSHAGRSNLS